MKHTSKAGKQFVAMMIALVCLIGSPTLTICSPFAASNSEYRTTRMAAPAPLIDWPASQMEQTAQISRDRLYDKLPVTFEANAGQTDARVKFVSRGDGRTLFLMPTEAMLTIGGGQGTGDRGEETTTSASISDSQSLAATTQLRMKLIGASPAASMFGEDEQAGKTSYLIGKDSRHWRTNLSTYGRVRCRNVYRGIDLIYHGNQQQLEYDFIVAPRANPQAITLDFDGAERLSIDASGDLVLSTPAGEVRHKRPSVYQESNGIRKEVAGRYEIKGRSRVAFRVAAYDKSKPLIIDPEIVYSTCFGGTTPVSVPGGMVKAEEIFDVAIDTFGNAYVTGDATSLDLPTTPGAFQSVNRTVGKHDYRSSDAFVAKFDPAGKLIYSTYFGGVGYDSGCIWTNQLRVVALHINSDLHIFKRACTKMLIRPCSKPHCEHCIGHLLKSGASLLRC